MFKPVQRVIALGLAVVFTNTNSHGLIEPRECFLRQAMGLSAHEALSAPGLWEYWSPAPLLSAREKHQIGAFAGEDALLQRSPTTEERNAFNARYEFFSVADPSELIPTVSVRGMGNFDQKYFTWRIHLAAMKMKATLQAINERRTTVRERQFERAFYEKLIFAIGGEDTPWGIGADLFERMDPGNRRFYLDLLEPFFPQQTAELFQELCASDSVERMFRNRFAASARARDLRFLRSYVMQLLEFVCIYEGVSVDEYAPFFEPYAYLTQRPSTEGIFISQNLYATTWGRTRG